MKERAEEERSRIGRTTFEILSSLPLDDLAANGESMVCRELPCIANQQRGKIFRMMLEMLRGDNPEEWVNELHDWCNLVSWVQSSQLKVVFSSTVCSARRQRFGVALPEQTA